MGKDWSFPGNSMLKPGIVAVVFSMYATVSPILLVIN
jgi:hypothetical protein